ncbi:CTL-like protein 2 isoform X1 [Sitophilus oryzae]|uniref:Choline transporter-like protein n=1 Tax=Sitophilus oryzae TaxID=7048 RepID=A0A6J2X3R5_SITOR|nr:CTL-like protein 2 isoform X1 [Sitophilus oryzae]
MQDQIDERDDFRNRQPIEYDPYFDGPTKKRSCTDVICLLLFLVFLGCWVGLGAWAIKKGDPSLLLVPTDSNGQRCGLDSAVQDKPYLFFFDLTKCFDLTTAFSGCNTPQVCVKSCPDFVFIKNTEYGNNLTQVLPYCSYDVQDSNSYDENNCPTWVVPSDSLLKRCVFNAANLKNLQWNLKAFKEVNVQTFQDYTNPVQLWLSLIVHNGIVAVKDDQNIHEVAQQIIADVITSWWKILIGVVFALLACIIFILMLRWIAGVIVWFSIIAVVVALGAGVYFSAIFYSQYKKEFEADWTKTSSKTKRDIFLGLLIITSVVLGIILLVLIFLRKRITLAIALVKEGSKAVSSVTSVLFFPIVPWVLQVGVVAYAICAGVYLATVGEPLYLYKDISDACNGESYWQNNTQCFPSNFSTSSYTNCNEAKCRFYSITNEAYYPYFQAFNIFEFFWMAFFITALGQMVLAQVFAKWYWTKKKSDLPFFAVTSATCTTLRYHLGTIAFGSLIIAICRIIRLCLEYIDRKLKKYDNELTKAIMCCLKCFFWCLEKFLKFINKNAYIMCAIHGKNFCSSAKDAFSLLVRNIIRVFILDKVTDFLFFLSKLVVTIGVGAVAYVFFATDLISFMDNSGLNYGVVPVIIIMIVTYLVATLFFNVYSMAVDTLFMCFLEDIERNDGKTKPYYMSRNLMKIFGKKNVIKKDE